MKNTPKDSNRSETGTLYIVATPIGNLEDVTLRALRILKEVDFIAAEDTRHTKKLLNHFGIQTKLMAYYREQEQQRSSQILQLLADGHDIAIVTDAGTPCISDPGAVIVQNARQHNYRIVPIPGPSALTAALSCAGIDDHPVMFYGFSPAKKSQRKKLFQSLVHADYYSVFYESPHRIEAFLQDAYELLGDRQVFMARELTKSFEELVQKSIQDLIKHTSMGKIRGEFVLIFPPAPSLPTTEMDIDELICWYRDNSDISLKDCCKTMAADLGLSKSKIYKRALELWQDSNNNRP